MSLIVTALAGLAAGCEEDEIRVYEAPRDPGPTPHLSEPPRPEAEAGGVTGSPPMAANGQSGSLPTQQSGPPPVTWTLPDDWTKTSARTDTRLATFQAGEGELAMEVALTAFPGDVGGPVNNINRWRGQLGLEPIDAETLEDHVNTFAAGDEDGEADDEAAAVAEGMTMRLRGPDGRRDMLAAIIDVGTDHTYFLRGEAAAEVVDAHESAFEGLARSLRPEEGAAASPPAHLAGPGTSQAAPQGMGQPGELPEGHPPLPQDGGAGPGQPQEAYPSDEGGAAPDPEDREVQWHRPPHWQDNPDRSPLAYASFIVHTDAGHVHVNVTPLRGEGGGLLENVNMWRRQVGLERINDLDEQPIEAIEVDGREGRLVDIVGRPHGETLRTLVAVVPDGWRHWYFRMSGPGEAVEMQREPFLAFLQSVRFESE